MVSDSSYRNSIYSDVYSSVSSLDSNASNWLDKLKRLVQTENIEPVVLCHTIDAIRKDNLAKFIKFAGIKVTLDEEDGYSLAQDYNSRVVFHRSDNDKVYLMHHILINKAHNILKYALEKVADWSTINLNYSMYLNSFSYLHLLALNLFYEDGEDGAHDSKSDSGCNHRALKCIRLLLDTPEIMEVMSLNAKDRLGASSLHYFACIGENLEIFKELVEKGANLSIKDREGSSIIHYAIKHNSVRNFAIIFFRYQL